MHISSRLWGAALVFAALMNVKLGFRLSEEFLWDLNAELQKHMLEQSLADNSIQPSQFLTALSRGSEIYKNNFVGLQDLLITHIVDTLAYL